MNSEYIEEIGTIVELKDHQVAVVLCRKSSACEHCASSGACQLGDDRDSMLVEAFNQIGAKINDRVVIVTSTRHFLQSSFMLYIVPIIGLLIGALFGQWYGETYATGYEPSLISALVGVVFLVATFLGIRFITRSLKKETFMPRIVAIQAATDTQADALIHGH